MNVLPALCLCLAALSSVQAQATTVWRCGPDGRSYADSPCPGGRELQVADDRSAQQRQEAAQVAERDRAIARRMTEERREREREWAARGSGLIAIGPVTPVTGAGPVKPSKRQSGKDRADPKTASKQQPAFAARGTSPSAARGSRRTQG